ncbi:glycosyltransferase family 4 protein [Altererythrobacter sp. GH1-8]|uniref:glycosyltransferase family 4 protein n=1 Tax=Altererythrobacter sp. GH1-8 TaxID=3349333 RepID=UPI00374CF963
MSDRLTRVLMLCSGVGRENRGIETFFADAFEGLKDAPGLDLRLGIGAGVAGASQERIASLSRLHPLAKSLGGVIGRDGYTIEQVSSIPSVLAKIRRLEPHVVFTSEANLAMRLKSLRSFGGVPYRLMYSNGAPMRGPFPWADAVHQVTPTYRDIAIEDGDDPERHILVPYGFTVPDVPPDRSIARRQQARRNLGLPEDRPIVLSVGWIARRHKRMDYVVDEIAHLPAPRPLLAMIGAMDQTSGEVVTEARSKLGAEGLVARSVPPSEVPTWYAAADVFVLGSLAEGFGRVYIEALSQGVPVFCHDYPVGRFVNGPEAAYGDFSKAGTLTGLIAKRQDLFAEDPFGDRRRWNYARDNFSWQALAPRYEDMFRNAANGPRRA